MHGASDAVSVADHKQANDSFDASSRWPVETYQVALLNIVFAFESGVRLALSLIR